MTAARQIERLGFRAADVRHIVLTHLDFDHAGGLDDFPRAAVHMLAAERDYALQQKTWMDRQRFRPQQWSTQRELEGLRAERRRTLVRLRLRARARRRGRRRADGPAPGAHVRSCGRRGPQGRALAAARRRRLLLSPRDGPRAPLVHARLARLPDHAREGSQARLANQRRLRELRAAHASEVDVFSGHDTVEFERLSGRSPRLPAEAFAAAAG